ncbi:MAG: hypothetical protein SFW64_04405 [Alphaproteobacteria bacterium]|nr:hypothetical protein [Alphaproteobacteria bacterium]
MNHHDTIPIAHDFTLSVPQSKFVPARPQVDFTIPTPQLFSHRKRRFGGTLYPCIGQSHQRGKPRRRRTRINGRPSLAIPWQFGMQNTVNIFGNLVANALIFLGVKSTSALKVAGICYGYLLFLTGTAVLRLSTVKWITKYPAAALAVTVPSNVGNIRAFTRRCMNTRMRADILTVKALERVPRTYICIHTRYISDRGRRTGCHALLNATDNGSEHWVNKSSRQLFAQIAPIIVTSHRPTPFAIYRYFINLIPVTVNNSLIS